LKWLLRFLFINSYSSMHDNMRRAKVWLINLLLVIFNPPCLKFNVILSIKTCNELSDFYSNDGKQRSKENKWLIPQCLKS